MRILLHCVYYPPEVGGLESHVSELARGLVEAGHEVRVVTSRSQPGFSRDEVRDGVRVRRTRLPSRTPAGWALHAAGSLRITRRWARWSDVVHAQAFASVVPCRVAARAAGRPLVATFHTSHFLLRAQRPLWRPVLGRLVRWPDHRLAASREIAEVAMALAPGVEVEALTNGVDTDRFAPGPAAFPPDGAALPPDGAGLPPDGAGLPPDDERERRIVVPRRLFEKNGVEHLIRAMPAIVRRVPGARALLVGDGPERTRLEALARELGVAGVVHFLGNHPHEDMPGLLRSGELAVFPSLMEATSVAALECMACGLPVVATRVGGLPEIVDDSVGRLVAPADPDALAAAVAELLEDGKAAELGRAARARVVAEWSNARLVARHLQIYGSLLEGRRGR